MPEKRTITFEDPDGNEVQEEWYFTLGRDDVLDMDIVHEHIEDFGAFITEIMKPPRDTRTILDLWRQLLLRSAGKREGNLIVKGPEILRQFRYSGAFECFLNEIMDAEDGGASFFISIMPKDVQEQVAAEEAKTYTTEDLLSMSDEEFARVAGRRDEDMTREHLIISNKRREAARRAAAA